MGRHAQYQMSLPSWNIIFIITACYCFCCSTNAQQLIKLHTCHGQQQAATMATYEAVETVEACRQAVIRLEIEEAVAVDSEGVNLSKIGPMTLLQIGTFDGRVFVFDVMRDPRMFVDGELKRLLENERVVKVLHSARNDAEALHAQFGVKLRHVHDTQLAEMELARADGAKFPLRQQLEEVCEVYCPGKAAVLKIKWNKTEAEYWAKRPLTQEMIQYAADDVIAIVPEVYTSQKQLLTDRNLTQAFKDHVAQDLERIWNSTLNEKLDKEHRELVLSTLQDFARTARRSIRLEDITDEVQRGENLDQLESLGKGDAGVLRDLKRQQIQSKMDEIEAEMKEMGSDFDPLPVSRLLDSWTNILDEDPLKTQAQRLKKAAEDMILADMKTKYTASTPVKHMTKKEQIVLTRQLRPKGEHDPSVNPVLLALYWKVNLADLEDYIEAFQTDRQNFTIGEDYVKKLKFYVSGDVPRKLKERGKAFLSALEEAGLV